VDERGYAPNLNHGGWMHGNHWAVAHRCSRCGRIEFSIYDPKGPHSGNLQEQRPPEGWGDFYVLGGLFCPSCFESYKEWLHEGRKAVDE